MSSLGDIFGSLISKSLSPGTPKASGILGNADAAYFGTLTPGQQHTLTLDQSKLGKLQGELGSATGAKQSHIQAAIDHLNAQITNYQNTAAQDKQNGYLNQFITNLGSELPQLQQISQAQNTAANQSALQAQQQFGLPAGQAILGAQQALAPQFYNNQTALGQALGQGGNLQNGSFQGLTPQQTAFYNQQFMGNQAAQGLGSSPLGAQNAAYQLTGLNMQQANTQEQQLQQYLNSYLQPSVPNIFGQQSQAGTTSATQLGGNSLSAIQPQSVLDLQAQTTGLKYANQQQFANSLGGSLGQLGGQLASSAVTGGFGGVGGLASGGSFGGGAVAGLGNFLGGGSSMQGLSSFFGGSSAQPQTFAGAAQSAFD